MASLFTADLHLSERIWANQPVVGDAQYALEQIRDLALDHEVHELILGGDIFDVARPPSEPVRQLFEVVRTLRQASCLTYYIDGDHDDFEHGSHLSILAGMVDWAPRHVPSLGPVRLHSGATMAGLDHQRPQQFWKAVDDLPEADILLCHQRWVEFMGDKISDLRLDLVPYAHVWTGDYHRMSILRLASARADWPDGKLQVLSPGATHMRRFGEPAEHFVFLIDEELKAVPVQLRSRKVSSLYCIDEEGLERVLTLLPAACEPPPGDLLPVHLRQPVLRIQFAPELERAAERLKSAVQKCAPAHLFLEPLSRLTIAPPEPGQDISLLDMEEALDRALIHHGVASEDLELVCELLRAARQGDAAAYQHVRADFIARRLHALLHPLPQGVLPVP